MFGKTCTHKKHIIHTRCCKNITEREQLAIDLELSSLKDKRLELEAKIESGEIDAKAGQNLVNLFKLTIASSQWSAGKISPKKFGKAAETLSIKSDNAQPLTISWSK